jgi:hypothetical protein
VWRPAAIDLLDRVRFLAFYESPGKQGVWGWYFGSGIAASALGKSNPLALTRSEPGQEQDWK